MIPNCLHIFGLTTATSIPMPTVISFVLSPLHDNKIEETVYLPREYVLLVVVQKTAPPPGEIGKMGFKLP